MILLRVGAPLFAATLALYLWARHLMAPMARLARAAQQIDLVREAVEDAEALGAARNVTASLGECIPTSVVGDRHRLRQVLLILCDNAVK